MTTAVGTEVSVAEVRELKLRKRVKMDRCKDKRQFANGLAIIRL